MSIRLYVLTGTNKRHLAEKARKLRATGWGVQSKYVQRVQLPGMKRPMCFHAWQLINMTVPR